MSGPDFTAYGYYAQTTGTGSTAPTTATTTSVYGENRPTFAEDGTGMPYTNIMTLCGSGAINSDISYDTSSKDPHMIRARVFIGNIARAIIVRDDIIELFRPFGKISAVNYFAQQGFGFVQFTEAGSADQSCLTLNGTQWKGCCLDVHLAMLGATKKPAPTTNQPLVPPVSVAPIAVVPTSVKIEAPSKKRTYEEDEYEIFKQNKRNKNFANGDRTTNEDLVMNEMCDTLICGHCRFVTSDYEEFKDHRIAGCNKWKDPEEPSHSLKCATCSSTFLGAWAMLEHLTEFHRMLLYTAKPLPRSELVAMRAARSTPSSQTSEIQPPAGLPTGTSAESTPSFAEQPPVYGSSNGTPQI